MATSADDPDDALDRLWVRFFILRADAEAGRVHTAVALRELRDLHAGAGTTGSAHVPVFRAEIRGEIGRLKSGGRP